MDNRGEMSFRRTFVVSVTEHQAFEEYTNGKGGWWPRDHNLNPLPCIGIGHDPEVGGEFYEISSDNSRTRRGEVLVWDPPFRLVVTWPLYFAPQGTEDRVSECEIRFHVHPSGGTRVELEHRGMHYTDALSFIADKFFGRYGWELVLRNYADYLDSGFADGQEELLPGMLENNTSAVG